MLRAALKDSSKDKRLKIRKATWIGVFLVISAAFVGLFFASHIEGYRGLGHGFFLLSRWRWTSGGFERIYHYQELHHYSKNLGMTVQCLVSPSGRFALYESYEGDGKLLLFDADTGKSGDVTDGDFARPSEMHWHEPEHQVDVLYFEKHKPSVIRLPN
jgi:hypothetical protein